VRDALVAGINLNIFNNHADMISMANIAQIVNVLQSPILTKGKVMVKTPTFYIFKMYNVHQDAKLVPVELKTEDYTFNGESIPAVTASASEKDGVISLTLTNANPNKSVSVNCSLNKNLKVVNAKVVSGESYSDYNDFDNAEKVSMSDFKTGKVRNKQLNLDIPAHSVLLVQLSKN